MTRFQKYLLALSVLLIVLAEIVKRVSMPEKATILVGLAEIAIAAGVGLVFGISTMWNAPADTRKE